MPKPVKAALYILFWVFVIVAFSIVAIILVFAASGYKYNLESGQIQKTGIIYIKSIPAKTSVYLDGELKSQKTPLKIPYLLPNTYNIKLTKKGYIDWESDTKVKAGKVSSFDRIVLFLSQRTTKTLANNTGDFRLSPNKNLIAYTNKSKDNLSFYNLQTDNSKSLYKSDGAIKLVSWSKNSRKILIKDNKIGYIAIDIGNSNLTRMVTKQTGKKFTKMLWNPANANYAYGLYKNRIYKINLINTTTKAIKNNVQDFALSNYEIIYIYNKKVRRLSKMNLEGQNPSTIKMIGFAPQELFVSKQGKIAIKDKAGNFYYYYKDNGEFDLHKLSDSVVSATWGKPPGVIENILGTEKLAYFSANEIEGFFQKRDPRYQEQKNYLVTRINQTINKIDWYSDFEHILFLADGEVHIIELNGDNNTVLAKNVKNFEWINNGKALLLLNDKGLKKMTIRK